MTLECLIFDLDGTISDPKEGICRSINYALEEHEIESVEEDSLLRFIGPPLDETFIELSGSRDPKLVASLVAKYRERYAEVGYAENVVYGGIPEALERLASIERLQLGVCTSKRVDFAERILEMFGLREIFSFVSGGDVGVAKWQQLDTLKREGTIGRASLMIGDRYIDLTAAHKNKLPSAGVLWGYGSVEELQAESPAFLLSEPTELLSVVAV